MSKYDTLLEQNPALRAVLDPNAKRSALRGSVRGVIDRGADQAARDQALSERTGIPRPVVERNRDAVQRRDALGQYDRLLDESPALASFLIEPDNAAVAHDDIENLSGLEWVFKAFGAAHSEQWETIELGRLRSQQLTGQLSDQQRARVEELSAAQHGADFGADGWWENVVVETGRLLPTMEAAIGGGIKKAALYGAGFAGAAALGGQAGPQVLTPEEIITVPGAALMGMGFGMAAGAAEEVYRLEGGLAYDEFLQMRDEQGNTVDDSVARMAASMVGAVNAGFELIGLGAIARTIPGARHLKASIGRTAVREALKQASFRNALTRFATSYAGAMGTEVTTEILQEASTILGAELVGQLSAGEFESMTPEEMGNRLAEIAVKTTQGMTLIAGAGPSIQLVSDAQNVQRARRNQQVFQALGEHAENSKLRQRLPEKFRQYVDQLREGGEIDAVRISVEEFDTYWQTEGLDPRAVYTQVVGSPTAYDEAQAAGTDVAIPIDRYAANLAGTRHHEALMPNMRLRPDDMTLREAEAWQAQSEQILEKLSQQLEPATKQSRAVYEDVRGQLLQTGMEEGTADQNAQLMASVFETLAQRTGTTAEELYGRYGLTVRREMPEVLRNLPRVDLELDPLIDRLRAGELPSEREIYGPSLSEFLREKGGLQDQGGELAARDAQKALRGLVKAEGMTFDEAAVLAQESGYIAERSEQALLDAIDREVRGEAVFQPTVNDQQLLDLRTALEDLDRYLQEQGVDLQQAGNEEVRQMLQGTVFDQAAYHGSPHRFDRFSLERIGTGEGAQAFGWGLYFAENPDVANEYSSKLAARGTVFGDVRQARRALQENDGNVTKARNQLNRMAREVEGPSRQMLYDTANNLEALAAAQGNVYEVDIADEAVERMLDWDAPLSEQPAVKRAVEALAGEITQAALKGSKGEATGATFYASLAQDMQSQEQASQALSAAGIPGIKYLDQISRGEGEGTRNLVVFDDSIIDIKSINGEPVSPERAQKFFEQRFDETRRGSIQFGRDRQFNINLLRDADLSTFLHESGHFYLEILGDLAEQQNAPEQIVQDYASILNWLGAESRQALGRDQHEAFARGFEAYLMEGKAPSVELQTAFARFRAWLVSIYQQLKSLRVSLNDEVRGVFDRMVATDDAIATAEQSQNYVALFTNAETAGMSPEQWSAYRKTVQDARIDAEDRLARQLMDVMRREELKWWREQKQRVRGEVEAEVHGMPVYQALSFLSRGTNPDGSAVENLTPVKLSKAVLEDEYDLPQEFLNRLPGHGPRAIYARQGGVHPDAVAQMFGYASGRAMLKALASARPMRELIEAETDARMRERYPDPLTDGSLADKAVNAVHSDKRAELLSAELRALRRKQAEVRPFVRAAEREAARDRRESREANRAQFGAQRRADDLIIIRAAAERIVGQKAIRDIQPHAYRVAEAKAARKAFEAAGRNDFETAYQEKRKEILNHELYRVATKGIEQSEKARKYFKKFGKRKVRERIGKAEGGYLERIEGLLADFSLRRISGKAIDRAQAKRDVLEQVESGELVVDQQTLTALRQDSVKNWRETSLDSFLGLRDTIRQIEHQALNEYSAIINNERVQINDVATEIGDSILAAGKEKALGRGQPTAGEQKRATAQSMVDGWLRPGNIARILDGQEWGPMTRHVVALLRQATVDKLLPALYQDYENFNALYAKHYSNAELRKFHDKSFFEGLSRSDVISMALYRGNETSWRALIEGVNRKKGGEVVYPQEFVERALRQLDARDYDFVTDLWKHFNSYWNEMSAAEKRRRGISPKKVEATPYTVTTADGQTRTLDGGYVPNSYDPRYDSSQRAEDPDYFKRIQTGSVLTASTRAGATHERVGSGRRVLALGLERMQRKHQEVIRDVAIGDEVNFVRRLLTSNPVVAAAQETGQLEALKALDTWLKDSATGEIPATHGIEKWLRTFRTNFISSKIGLSAITSFLQVTGTFPSMAILGRKAFGHGLGRYLSNPKQWHDWIMEQSAFMRARYRLDTLNKDLQDASTAVGLDSSALPTTFHRWNRNARQFFFAPIKAFQLPVDEVTFLGAYWKGAQMGLEGDELVSYADARVEEAQTSGLFVDRSNFERGSIGNVKQSQFLRMWSSLIGYMLAQANNMYERGVGFKRRPTLKNAIIAATFFGHVYILQTMAEAFMRGNWPDDDDEEPFAWWLTKRSSENVVSGVPFLREYQSFGYGAGGDTPVTSWLSDVYKSQEQMAQGEIDEPLTKNVINAIGGLTGLPSTQINRAVDAYFAEQEGDEIAPYEYITGQRERD